MRDRGGLPERVDGDGRLGECVELCLQPGPRDCEWCSWYWGFV